LQDGEREGGKQTCVAQQSKMEKQLVHGNHLGSSLPSTRLPTVTHHLLNSACLLIGPIPVKAPLIHGSEKDGISQAMSYVQPSFFPSPFLSTHHNTSSPSFPLPPSFPINETLYFSDTRITPSFQHCDTPTIRSRRRSLCFLKVV